MITTKTCDCGQKLEFESEDAPYINCPACGRSVSDLLPAAAAANPEPVKSAAQPPPLPRAKGLYVIIGQETKGPYSLKQIKAMYESGQLTMDTMCCRDGDKQWRPLVEWESEIYRDERRAPIQQIVMAPPIPVAPRVNPNDAMHPAVAALLGFLCLTGLAQMMMGQGGKGCMILLGAIIIGFFTGGIGFFIVHPIVAIDAIMVAQALRAGRPVGPYDFFPAS